MSIKPSGDHLRSAVKCISEERKADPEKSLKKIINEAGAKFNPSPADMDYDLWVYNGDNSSTNCSATPVQGQGTPETVTASWGDVGGPGTDGRWLSIEVRYVSGDYCDAGHQWSLTVTGNTQ